MVTHLLAAVKLQEPCYHWLMPRYLAFCWRFCKVIRDGAPTPVPRFRTKLLRSELGQVPTWFWAAAGGRIAEIQVQTLEKHTILSNMKIMCGYVWYENFCCLILSLAAIRYTIGAQKFDAESSAWQSDDSSKVPRILQFNLLISFYSISFRHVCRVICNELGRRMWLIAGELQV